VLLLLLLLPCWLQVLEGATGPLAGPALVAAGNAALAAASGSSSSRASKGSSGSRASRAKAGQGSLLAVKGVGLGLRPGCEVQLRGSWEQHETYGWQIT
jgi:hypothetical protein